MSYGKEIATRAKSARGVLIDKGIGEDFLIFSADPQPVPNRIWAPAQGQTKFQMEQALGDWAEDLVRDAINGSGLGVRAVAFGDNDKTMAQDESFADRYRTGKVRELQFGKRSDLLLFDEAQRVPDDASALDGKDAERLCRSCLAALEIRSSRTSAKRFVAYTQQQKAAGKRPARMEPSITVKIEDLAKVYRWIARNGKLLFYIQVFFDELYALDFAEVFTFINDCGKRLKLEDPARSGKKTIMIPVSRASRIGSVQHPSFRVVHNQHDNGRHDVFAEPFGGAASLDRRAFLGLLR